MSLRYQDRNVDEIDAAILSVLFDNARISLAELARRVGMSSPSVSDRMKRLEDIGAIKGYSAVVDPAALGRPLAIMLRIRPIPGAMREVAELIQTIPDITDCVRVTGEDCFVATAYVRSVADLETLIDKIVPQAMTTTSIIQSSPIEPRLPPLMDQTRD